MSDLPERRRQSSGAKDSGSAREGPQSDSPPGKHAPAASHVPGADEPLTADSAARLRWMCYWLLIAVAVGGMTGRIMAVDAVDQYALERYRTSQHLEAKRKELIEAGMEGDELRQQLNVESRRAAQRYRTRRPFLSGNDRSRLVTVRSLVEHGTYEIDKVVDQRGWDTIDMVMHRNRDGEMRRYSSKPPLLATLIAGEYWVIHKLTGETLGTRPYEIGRVLLFSVNVLPLLLAFYLLAQIVERVGTSDWGRMFAMAVFTLGTFLNTFAVVINNHLPGAVSVVIALYAAVRIWWDGERRLRYFALAGFFAAFAATCELPALSFFGLLGLALLFTAPRATLIAGVPAAAVVAAAFFGTNYIAHDSWRPPYMHRSKTNPDDNWYDYTYVDSHGRYRESYWREGNKIGLDRGEPSVARYAFHVTFGHHGIFSLTPVWLLTVAGLALGLASKGDPRLRGLMAFIAALSALCLLFYIFRPLADRNYGGMTSGFRWMFWFAPMWAIGMLPALDRMRSRWLYGLALIMLAASVLSAAYPTWNPWTHPWIYNYWFI